MTTCNTCDAEWPRDPAFMVDCPTCDASSGQKCRRPSGHLVWTTAWPGLPKGCHAKRDIRALKEGAYDRCECGPDGVEDLPPDNPFSPQQDTTHPSPQPAQQTLFDQ